MLVFAVVVMYDTFIPALPDGNGRFVCRSGIENVNTIRMHHEGELFIRERAVPGYLSN